MGISKDPEGFETATLFQMADFSSLKVLEIGSGDGRFTNNYAHQAAHVTAIDPNAELLEKARANLPPELRARVEIVMTDLDGFTASAPPATFDTAIFSWSL